VSQRKSPTAVLSTVAVFALPSEQNLPQKVLKPDEGFQSRLDI
jgi:hypothetical protein